MGAYGIATSTPAIPSYPPPTRAGDFSIPTPGFSLGNTVTSLVGVPLGDPQPAARIGGGVALNPAGPNVQVEPLSQRPRMADSIYYASVLRHNMLREGQVPPAGWDAHYIVPANDPRAALPRAILKQAGIDLNGTTNGVFLPRDANTPNPTGATVHNTLHTFGYYQELTSRLVAAGLEGAQDTLS